MVWDTGDNDTLTVGTVVMVITFEVNDAHGANALVNVIL